MSIREDIAALIDLPAPDYRVIPWSASLDRIEVGQVVVVIARTDVRPAPQHARRTHTASLWVLVPKLVPGSSDDALDDALDDILTAIEDAPGLLWETAERGTYDDQYPSYRITVTLTTDRTTE